MADAFQIQEALEQALRLLAAGDNEGAAEFLRTLHPADSAEVVADMEPDQQASVARSLEPGELADIFEQLDEDEMADVAEHLELEQLADVLDEMEADMAADLLGELDEAEVSQLLTEMDDGSAVETLLAHAEDSAGGIMNTPPPCLRRWMAVAEAIRFLRTHYESHTELYYLYVLDRFGVLIGLVELGALLLADAEQTIEEIMERDVVSVHVETDQEDVAELLARYDLLALPVIDDRGRLAGIITVDDVVDVITEEATEDIYRLAQISENAAIFSPMRKAIQNRLPWLYLNLVTALVSASVVTLFQGTIAAIPILAAFMPVIAAQGGNAGNQTMTLVVRSLALGEIELSDAWEALRHELLLGMSHGLVLGISLGIVAYLVRGNYIFGAIIVVAMFLNLTISALVGVMVPLTLKRLKVDPALASSMFVTATTDIAGFAIFLGLATYLFRWIL